MIAVRGRQQNAATSSLADAGSLARAGQRPRSRRPEAYRHDYISSWPQAAYEEDVFVPPLPGRTVFLINSPRAIRRVLVENADNYRRTRESHRIFRPLVGEGLFLSEGEARMQRRRALMPLFSTEAMAKFVRSTEMITDDALGALATGRSAFGNAAPQP